MLINSEGQYGGKIYYGSLSKQRILLKVISSKERSKMEQEETMLSSLSHENIARIFYSLKLTGNKCVLLTEFIGKNIKDVVRGLDEIDMRIIMYQLAKVVSYLQEKRIMYLGLFPKNIFVLENSDYFVVKLINFHNAQRIDSNYKTEDFDKFDDGFSAPEIMNKYSEKTVHLSSDIYSLGCLFFYILSGGFEMIQVTYLSQIDKITARLKIINEDTSFRILCKHLIEKMLVYENDKRISHVEILSHPIFWTSKDAAAFIIETGILIEKDKKYFDYLTTNGERAIAFDWTKKLDGLVIQVLKEIRQNTKKSSSNQDDFNGKKAGYLVKIIRNSLVHATDERLVPMMGTKIEDLLKFWNEKFPLLILFLYNSKLEYNNLCKMHFT